MRSSRTEQCSDRPSRRLSSLGNKRASHPWHESRLLHSGASAAPGWRVGGGWSAASVRGRWYGSVQHQLTLVLRLKIRQSTESPHRVRP
ncbi:MAG: hypothetical protein AB2803_20060 [Candidatus Thiodiazotropha sp.]